MHQRTIFTGIASFAFIAFTILAAIVFAKPASFRGAAFGEPYPPAPQIELTRSDGSRFRLSEQRGAIVLIFFGYTSCPDVCPTTLAELNQALSELPADDAAQVNVVFITVDPERDTPERMQEYVSRFNAAFIGLSGSQAELETIWNSYGVFREAQVSTSALEYLVDHTARVTLVDRQGTMRVSFGFDTPVEDMVHDLKLVLKE